MSTITPLPTPPSRQDPANFSDRADDFLGALPLFATEANTVAGEVNTNALNASTSASTATTQAGIATTQAGIATTKAGEALASADLAEDWAIKTDAPVSGSDYSSKYYSLEAKALNEKYQGSLVSDPTLDKEGNPISAGDWYINSSSGFIRVYNGASWVQGIASVAGVSSINGNSGVLVSKDVVPALTSNAGKVLKVNSGATNVEWGYGLASGYQEFTSSGTWTKPAEATWVYVEAIGGGASGGVLRGSASNNVKGGGGGGFSAKLLRAQDLSGTITVTVGGGGNAVTQISTGNSQGANGGDSSFGSYLIGRGGQWTSYSSNGGGGELGGLSALSPGNGGYSSGGGGSGAVGGSCVMGGAGGGGAAAVGSNTGGKSALGGDGGDGAVGNSTDPTTAQDGSFPGGGGGGASAPGGTVTSGAGGNGRVRVWWW